MQGAITFLKSEFAYLAIFVLGFSVFVLCSEHFQGLTTFAFIVGSITSLLCGYIGMRIATKTNVRVTFLSSGKNEENALSSAFVMAYRGGIVMGFCLVSMALSVLTLLIIVYMGNRVI
jgi:inorganic pyrophosphatase